ncbi:UNVERIFIED_CONTAM: hypothetical protein K2H54_056724 [Gekko kuhli]
MISAEEGKYQQRHLQMQGLKKENCCIVVKYIEGQTRNQDLRGGEKGPRTYARGRLSGELSPRLNPGSNH